jgi:hypothetical protein
VKNLQARAKEQEISDPKLKQIVAQIMKAIPGSVKLPSSAIEQGPVVHVDLSFLTAEDWQGLVRSFPVVLASLVTLNAQLVINIDGARTDSQELETQIQEVANSSSIKLKAENIKIVDAGADRPFVSLDKMNKADALMAGDKAAFDQIQFHKGIGSLWIADEGAGKNMPLLAAEISTVLYAALDENIKRSGNRFEIHQPSKYGSGALLQAVLTAVQAYLQIRAAA